VFVSERGAPFSTRGFQAMVERAAKLAGFDMKIHPHKRLAFKLELALKSCHSDQLS
jgi:site-specific recombinase XerD